MIAPVEIPPLVMTALLPKLVEPAPLRLATVMVPVAPEKFRLLVAVSALLIAPKFWLMAARMAVPLEPMVRVLPLVRLPAAVTLSVPPLTVVPPL